MKKNIIFLISVIIVFIAFLFIRKVVINNGYELLSWVYNCMFLIVNLTIIIETLFFIGCFLKKWDRFVCSVAAVVLEIPVLFIISWIVAFKINLKHEVIIKYEYSPSIVESYDFFQNNPLSTRYEYINCFIRDNKNPK